MVENNIQLDTKLVGQIEGEFYVPSYQRGYRWEERQVADLLDDIYNNKDKPYCLQPVVVRKSGQEIFELIDGQQRLTTLFIIYKFMVNNGWLDEKIINYSLTYETRGDNTEFFNHIDNVEQANKNIDFFFMHRAYITVKEWFAKREKADEVAKEIYGYFSKNVKVIWYELQSGTREDATNLFTRINAGRIPLTNAELVKALFLCKSEQVTKDKQLEIALQWDTIERELHDEDFWYFLTKKKSDKYPTRIELLFDFIAHKKDSDRNQYYTFDYFNKGKSHILSKWGEVTSYYYHLKEWYKKDDWYHKTGYLVASGYSTIDQLMENTKDKKKKETEYIFDQLIKESVSSEKPYEELSYEKDYSMITRILLLFNVVSLMKNGSKARFPFKEFNNDKWSLEHIHAQHSEGLNTLEKWKEWLRLHLDPIKGIKESEKLVEAIQQAIDNDHLTNTDFNNLVSQITAKLSLDKDVEYVHTLANMALLQGSTNSALNNSLFDAKRRIIVKMDAEGKYIPYCTKMVFMKYYSPDNASLNFWGETDRKAYIKKMNEILEPYLKNQIKYDSEQSK